MANPIPLGNLQTRLLGNLGLADFIWCQHNYSTSYLEQYQRVGVEKGQGYVPLRETRPVRVFALKFETMFHLGHPHSANLSLCAYSLIEFYKTHGLTQPFRYTHPVYGELKVLFNKPLSLPARNPNGGGTLSPFEVELREVPDRAYLFHPDEQVLPYPKDWPFVNHTATVDYPEDSNRILLGDGCQVTFKNHARQLRTFRLTLEGMCYYLSNGHLSFIKNQKNNILALEAFYNHYRLDLPFTFCIAGEKIPVVFKNPLKLNYLEGNQGYISGIQVELYEHPYTLTTGFVLQNPEEGGELDV